MTRRSTVVAALGATVAVCIALAAPAADAGPASPDKTLPTPPPSTLDPSTPTSGIGIRAAATLTEFLPLANAVIGTTGDVAGALSGLARVPSGVQSPAGATITGFSIVYHAIGEYYVATVRFSSDATAEDAVTFFQATLSSAGFTPVTDSGGFDGDPATRTLHFANPMSPHDDAAVDVAVDDTGDVELTITDSIDAEVMNAFTGWAEGLPTLTEAVPIEASIAVMTGATGRDLTMTLTTAFAYDDRSPEELAAAVRDGLPGSGFSLDPVDAGSGATITLRHVAMEDVSGEVNSGDGHPALLSISGTITI